MVYYAIVADDLSGSSDTAVTFSNYGYRSAVLNYPEGANYKIHNCDVVAISTNSREVSSQEAQKVVRDVCRSLKEMGVREIYKKIDSTWRGNIGAELEAMMAELGLSLAVICSAFPKTGRLVKEGYLLINGVPLHETPIAKDPSFPVKDSYLPRVLQGQTSLPVKLIEAPLVAQGPRYLTECLKKIAAEGKCLVLIDALDEKDLNIIASLEQNQLPPLVFCGSAGLSGALIRNNLERIFPKIPPVLVIVGSVHPQNQAMVNYLIGNNLAKELFLDPVPLLAEEKDYAAKELLEEGKRILKDGYNLIVRTSRGQEDQERAKAAGRQRGLSDVESAYCIAEGIQKYVQIFMKEHQFSGMIVTGGTTALHVIRGFAGVGIEVEEELEPGIPYGRIIGGSLEGMGLVTKAGGFGSEQVFAKAIQHLQRKYMQGRR
ncbi:MAG: hypothetical protein JG781_1133 [Peptococcaceae bacterium]|jgi:uncharacterized protein YgbK (DUF1537 family)|nr:hypothetical protein [Peptococcaceae bacterium]